MNKGLLIQLVNDVRNENNLAPLTVNDKLTQSAQYRAEEICSTGNFSHDNWKQSLTYDYHMAGENLAKNYATEEATVQAWVNSPKHYENIVKPYTETGIGAVECGNEYYIVQHFGTPPAALEKPTAPIHDPFMLPVLVLSAIIITVLVIKTACAILKS